MNSKNSKDKFITKPGEDIVRPATKRELEEVKRRFGKEVIPAPSRKKK